MRRVWLHCFAGFAFDWVLYVVWTVIPLYAEKELGADALQLSLLPVASLLVYIPMSIVMGRLADRVSRALLVRVGCGLMVAGCAIIPLTHSVWTLIAVCPLIGLSGTFFWPSIQASLASEAPPGRLERDLGLFNILWSLGKALGFVTGAALKSGMGTTNALMAAAAGALVVAALYPRDLRSGERGGRGAGDATVPADHVDPRRRDVFLRMAWIMNFVAFGIGATLSNQYIKFADDHHVSLGVGRDPVEFFFGLFLGAVYAGQTVTFVVLTWLRGWTYKRGPHHAVLLFLAAASLPLAHVTHAWVILGLGALIGVGIGFGYAASIYYSLHTPAGHGKFSGLHEAILGSGNFVLPLAGGALARATGDLRWPYWLCAAAALMAAFFQEAIHRTLRPRTSQARPS